MAIFAIFPLFMIFAVIGVIAASYNSERSCLVTDAVERPEEEVTLPAAA